MFFGHKLCVDSDKKKGKRTFPTVESAALLVTYVIETNPLHSIEQNKF